MAIKFNDKQIEAAAIAICIACEDNPYHVGDCRGNDYRWQDYIDVAKAGLNAAMSFQDNEELIDEPNGDCIPNTSNDSSESL